MVSGTSGGPTKRVRHSPKTIAVAQRMHQVGWTPHQIQKALTKAGTPVSWATVKSWVDPEYRKVASLEQAQAKRVHRARMREGDYVLRQILKLRAKGLSHRAIAVVVEEYHGRTITESTVRNYLDRERQAA